MVHGGSRLLGRSHDDVPDCGFLTMSLSINVHSIVHTVLRSFGDDEQGTFISLCRASVGVSCTLGFVYPYSDTMFNSFQLKQFLVDLDAVVNGRDLSDDQAAMVQKIRDAAQEAIAKRGYLFIIGD
jgi:hypothetical protein